MQKSNNNNNKSHPRVVDRHVHVSITRFKSNDIREGDQKFDDKKRGRQQREKEKFSKEIVL